METKTNYTTLNHVAKLNPSGVYLASIRKAINSTPFACKINLNEFLEIYSPPCCVLHAALKRILDVSKMGCLLNYPFAFPVWAKRGQGVSITNWLHPKLWNKRFFSPSPPTSTRLRDKLNGEYHLERHRSPLILSEGLEEMWSCLAVPSRL